MTVTWNDFPNGRADGTLVQDLGDELLVFDQSNGKVLCLSNTSAAIWRNRVGTNSIAMLTQLASRALQAPVSEPMVWMALKQLKAMNLVAGSYVFTTPFDRMSRREWVKRVGLAAIALPVIHEIVAPTAAYATSHVCGPIGNCTGASGSTSACVCNPSCHQAAPGDRIGGCTCGTPCGCSGSRVRRGRGIVKRSIIRSNALAAT